MTKAAKTEGPEYTLAETIKELDGWLNHGKRFYPIDTAISANYWLQLTPPVDNGKRPECGLLLSETVAELEAWLCDEEPHLSADLGEAALYWLQRARKETG